MRLSTHHLPRLSALALAAALGSAHAAGPTLDVDATSAGALLGGTAILSLTIGLSADVPLDGLDVRFDFDPAGLSFNPLGSTFLGLPWTDFLGVDGVVADTDASDGQLGFSVLLPAPTLLSAGLYPTTLAFVGLQVGSFRVDTTLDMIYTGDDQIVQLSGGSSTLVNISPIPEPTPTALLLGGLAMLGWLARRRAA